MHKFLIMDKEALRLVAAADTPSHISLIAEVEFSNVPVVILNTADGGSWTILTGEELSGLYRNMSGMEPPSYGECIAQLRQYGETWPAYSKSEAELAAMLVELEKLDTREDIAERAAAAEKQKQVTYQTIINAAHKAATAANPALARPAESIPAAQAVAASRAATPSKSEPSAPRKPGATKMVWDICDDLHAQVPLITDIKAFREAAKKKCVEAGINEGTFGVQFGKWKSSKGV